LASEASRATATSPLLTKVSPSKVTDWAWATKAMPADNSAATPSGRKRGRRDSSSEPFANLHI
jgi:hypothetical protein